jgi:hypothetical protein
MHFLKLGLISVIVLFIVTTAISLLLPSRVLVSRAADMHGSTQRLTSAIGDLQNWQNWMTDAKGEKGIHSYDGKSGLLTIGPTKIKLINKTDSTVITNWQTSTEMTGTFRIINHHTPDSLFTVQWQMEQHVKWYPWEKFASITKDELWGGSMEKSLDNLKSIIEGQ